MAPAAWAELDTGLGALIAELEAAESGEVGLGKAPDWSGLKEKAGAIKAHVASVQHDYSEQRGKLQNAAKHIDRLQGQLAQIKEQQPALQGLGGAAMPARPGVGQAAAQTVYLSAGATAGIAAGALLIGAVGGFATKAIIDSSKGKKKMASEQEAKNGGSIKASSNVAEHGGRKR
jgi:hypothetical protein